MNKKISNVIDIEYKEIIESFDKKYSVYENLLHILKKNSTNEDVKSINIKKDKEYFLPIEQKFDSSKLINEINLNSGLAIQADDKEEMYKSIINIVCDFLAKGKRVLITSNDYSYLKKIEFCLPEYLKLLSFRVTDNDNTFNEMDNLIKIINKPIFRNKEIIRNKIIELKTNLNEEDKIYKKIYSKIVEVEKMENSIIRYNKQKLKPWQLAKWVSLNQSNYGWIGDFISMEDEPPMSDAKFSKLIYLLSNVNPNEVIEYNECYEILSYLPSSEELWGKIEKVNMLSKKYSEYEKLISKWNINKNKQYNYKKLLTEISVIKNYFTSIEEKWIKQIVINANNNKTILDNIREFILKTNSYTKRIEIINDKIKDHKFIIPEDMEMESIFEEMNKAKDQYISKGKINKVYRIMHSKYNYIIENSIVDSSEIDNLDNIELFNYFIEKNIIEIKLINYWNENLDYYKYGEVEELNILNLNKINIAIKKLEEIINFYGFIEKFKESMNGIEVDEDLDLSDLNSLEEIHKGIIALNGIREYNDLNMYIENLVDIMKQYKSLKKISEIIKKSRLDVIREEYNKVENFKANEITIKNINRMILPLRDKCPILVKTIISDDDRVTMLDRYKNFSKAFMWKKFHDFLKRYEGLDINVLQRKLKKHKNKIDNLKTSLICENIIYNGVLETGKSSISDLNQWFEMLKKSRSNYKEYIEKKNILQNKMIKCYKFIPLWVMPLEDVIINMPLNNNLFDLIIMFDGNHISLQSISILLRGKKSMIWSENTKLCNNDKIIYNNKNNDSIYQFSKKIYKELNLYSNMQSIKFEQWIHDNNEVYNNSDFKSQFKKDVYKIFKEKGYNIKINNESSNYFDFFIDTNDERYIIQCDGDFEFNNNLLMNRYNIGKKFENLGWKTILIRGSEFYRNPQLSIEKVLKDIKEYKVNRGIA
ncbi:hypothetical protein SH2C18_34160 [Clostridium sediminicola]|uniref:hypothetical protein n=1 Tax=Clostridium sediminicola TaxID=3114879 RepID=UPI0031F267FF